MRRLIVVFLALGFSQALVTAVAGACTDCGATASGESNGSGGTVAVRTSERSGGSAGSNGRAGSGAAPSNPITCKVFEGVPDGADSGSDIPTELDTSSVSAGTLVWQTCSDAVTGEYLFSGQFAWGGAPGVPYVPPEVLARQARAQLDLPRPAVQSWPAADAQVVRLPTWLHVANFTAFQQTATVGAASATVYAEPVRVDWAMGDGGEVTCSSAGEAFDAGVDDAAEVSDCSYTFGRTSADAAGEAFNGSVSIVWHLRWDSNLGDTGDLGSVVMRAPVSWRVEQIQSVITHEGGRS